MSRLLLLFLTTLVNACSFTDVISSSMEQKSVAYKSHRNQWKRSTTPSRYGRARSVQLFEGKKVAISGNELTVTGKMGMASLLTADGYALTAAHVVSGLSRMDTVFRVAGSGRAPVHAQWTTRANRYKNGKQKSLSESVQLVSYDSSVNFINSSKVNTAALRVVKVFPNRDLALIKLPVRASQWFTKLDASPPVGTVVFASGNSATPYLGPSAGEVVALKHANQSVRTIDTSVPLASGDSGGPAFDASGRLLGIISHVRPSHWLPVPKLNHSSLRMMEPAALQQLIHHDRLATRQRR